MDLGLNDKVALVAGASKGIGKAVALALAKEGARLSICARGEEALFETASQLGEMGCNLLPIKGDISVPRDVEQIANKTIERFGHIDILIMSGGIYSRSVVTIDDFENLSDDKWKIFSDYKFNSYVWLCRQVIPHMKKQRWGRILNLSTATLKTPGPKLSLSNSIRLAGIGLFKTLATELAEYNILVNSVCMGYFETETEKLFSSKVHKENSDFVLKDIPLGRKGNLDEIASVVAFLASDRSSYITGSIIHVDGGLSRSLF